MPKRQLSERRLKALARYAQEPSTGLSHRRLNFYGHFKRGRQVRAR